MIIRELKETDLKTRVLFLNDPLITDGLNLLSTINIDDTIKWFHKRDLNTRFDCVFEIESDIVGMGGLTDISDYNRNASLYIYIAPKYWGKGLGSMALNLLCNYGFNDLNLHKIYLYTFTTNVRANRLYEQNGFKHEGTLRSHTLKDGVFVNRNIYGLLKQDFK